MGYVNYNINPKGRKTGDCAIRAVAVATGLGWDEAYNQLAAAGFLLKCAMNYTEAIEAVLVSNGFSVGKVKVPRGSKRPTVEGFAQEHPNWYAVLRVSNHLVATGKGNYVDIWDCGECSVYKYWYKPVK